MRLSSPARSSLWEASAERMPRARGERILLIDSDRGEQLKDSLMQLSRLTPLRPPSQLPARSAARSPAAASGRRLA